VGGESAVLRKLLLIVCVLPREYSSGPKRRTELVLSAWLGGAITTRMHRSRESHTGLRRRYRSCESPSWVLKGSSRQGRKYLSKGPPKANVDRVEYIREVDGPEKSVVEELLGGNHKGDFEIRRHH
jgi:hypothetical protein